MPDPISPQRELRGDAVVDNCCLTPLHAIKRVQMAFTPSKDYKRREREQKKAEKRMAREAAKAELKAAGRAASPRRADCSGN